MVTAPGWPAAVVFDCDGVLVDSERLSVRVGLTVLADLGWHLTEREFVDRFVGCSQEHYEREVAAGVGRVLEPGWETAYAGRYRDVFAAELEAVPGVEAVLDHLDEHGVPYGVASNSDRRHVRRVLGLSGLAHRFDDDRIFSAHEVVRGKPAPDVYLRAAAGLGVAPQQCAAVEDSPPGVTAALAAGMTCLAFAGGMTPRARLAPLGATLFDDMAELTGLLGLPSRLERRPASEPVDNDPAA